MPLHTKFDAGFIPLPSLATFGELPTRMASLTKAQKVVSEDPLHFLDRTQSCDLRIYTNNSGRFLLVADTPDFTITFWHRGSVELSVGELIGGQTSLELPEEGGWKFTWTIHVIRGDDGPRVDEHTDIVVERGMGGMLSTSRTWSQQRLVPAEECLSTFLAAIRDEDLTKINEMLGQIPAEILEELGVDLPIASPLTEGRACELAFDPRTSCKLLDTDLSAVLRMEGNDEGRFFVDWQSSEGIEQFPGARQLITGCIKPEIIDFLIRSLGTSGRSELNSSDLLSWAERQNQITRRIDRYVDRAQKILERYTPQVRAAPEGEWNFRK